MQIKIAKVPHMFWKTSTKSSVLWDLWNQILHRQIALKAIQFISGSFQQFALSFKLLFRPLHGTR